MANMIPISTLTVGSGGSSSFSFTGIPQTYTDLVLKCSARGAYQGIKVQFNSDSSASYSWKAVQYQSTSAVSESDSVYGSPYNTFVYVRGATASTSGAADTMFGSSDIYIPNYTSAFKKSMIADSCPENTTSIINTSVITAGIWANTAPITTITLGSDSGSFAQYTTVTLYGIRKY